MPEYKVTWTIDIVAENAVEAARKAKEIQLDPENLAVVFDVTDERGDVETVDLLDIENGDDEVERCKHVCDEHGCKIYPGKYCGEETADHCFGYDSTK